MKQAGEASAGAADTVYGVGAIKMALRRAGKGHVLGVSGARPFNSWGIAPIRAGTAEAIATELDERDWQRLSAGEGTKGTRLYDWLIALSPTSMPLTTTALPRAYGRAGC